MKQLPYGISDFKRIRENDMYYVDKTRFLPLMEEENSYLFLIRPRRFGKSLLISVLETYYDINEKDNFHKYFDGLYIGTNPTRDANSYQVLRFDFSKAGGTPEALEKKFNEYCCGVLDDFILKYARFYEKIVVDKILNSEYAESKLNLITIAAKRLRLRLYLIIDEYDNFTNDVLSTKGKEVFQSLTHADGFYRRFFKLFKDSFERIFMLGISPITLDDLTSGYNIDWNISDKPKFNTLLGFEESEVREMLLYYNENANVPADIDAVIEDMKPWYDNYCFAAESYGKEAVYNCDMALYYIKPMIEKGLPPKDMVDKNVRTDFTKLRQLINLDRGMQRADRLSDIERIANDGYIKMRLKTSFPAAELLDRDNFRSLIYYYGMLTIGDDEASIQKMVIPNQCVKQLLWGFLANMYKEECPIDVDALGSDYIEMVYNGDWEPAIKRIGDMYHRLSSVRDSRGGEFNQHGFFKAMLGLCNLTILCPEMELNYGYSDFVMVPLLTHYPKAKHCYIFEMKYVGANATDAEIESQYAEAEKQIYTYSADPRLIKLIPNCTLHGITLLFCGHEMRPPRLIFNKKL